ncbi:CPBP family intramembrane glutamic endopeptidase [Neptunitalea lumnitzerae]|uniref:CAAX prenyl protease 2/Lysostaphin resistance protein A-like domain-containing protein n=1 Tax=Neptunitalea lumnitzerae TaxID=2965509 RepID=A0ABQ5MHB8_9FLAO|nr:CPBP family intramembrane glutamic endopeptidase [Neptunitalea sp. Y10]GLB48757.1 hypothetical protein Y10_11250 [Neptunitalea sp. Y10]
MKKSLRVLLLVAVSFLVFYFFNKAAFGWLRSSLSNVIGVKGISHIITYCIVGVPLFVGTLVASKENNFLRSLGLRANAFKGFGLALVFTLPMLIGGALFFNFNTEITWDEFLIGAVAAAFFEELYFRGFLFGLLFKNTKIGFIPAIIVGAVLFAMGHLYQSTDPAELIGIFTMTFLGAVLFAWVYCEWGYNLWVAISLHFWMNFSWMLFSVSETALGGSAANIFRFTTVAFVIVGTVVYKLRTHKGLEVNRKTLWIKM